MLACCKTLGAKHSAAKKRCHAKLGRNKPLIRGNLSGGWQLSQVSALNSPHKALNTGLSPKSLCKTPAADAMAKPKRPAHKKTKTKPTTSNWGTPAKPQLTKGAKKKVSKHDARDPRRRATTTGC